jgi:hypothetical protein
VSLDFRDGKTFPRRGRKPLGRFLWLARVIDKARATAAGTHHDYIYPCPMDLGMMERWHVTREDFEAALARHSDDGGMLRWAQSQISDAHADAANTWVSTEKFKNLNKQDEEENAFD